MRAVVAAGVFVALALLRTHGISDNFAMLGDQIRDWTIALRGWRDLPLSGTTTWAGGRTWGPSYYWVLWLIRVVVGPWVHNLPHAGGIGISMLQSAADSALLLAIWRRIGSLAFALGAVLLIATNPLDLVLSATIWNPPVSEAFVKLAIASALFAGPSIWWAAAATGVAWLGVQAHLFAIIEAAPLAAGFVVRELLAKKWRRAVYLAQALVATIFVLEIPYLIDLFRHPLEQVAPTTLRRLLGQIHLLTNTAALLAVLRNFMTWTSNPIVFNLLVATAVVFAVITIKRDAVLASVSVLPLAAAIGALATWQSPLDGYWLISLYVPFVLTLILALNAAPPRWSRAVAVAFLVAVVAIVPGRVRNARRMVSMPQYGPLARGSLAIRQRTSEISRIKLMFDLPWTSRADFIYTTVLGGRILPSAPYSATIERDGSVIYIPTAR